MSKINFVRASLTKTQYATTFVNKTKKNSINNPSEGENYVLTTQDTVISCITAEQDFNYFLAKGCRKEISVSNCEAGFPFSKLPVLYTKFYYSGNISYTVQPGKISRSQITLYGEFKDIPLISNTTYSLEPTLNLSVTTSYYFPSIDYNSFSSTTYSFT